MLRVYNCNVWLYFSRQYTVSVKRPPTDNHIHSLNRGISCCTGNVTIFLTKHSHNGSDEILVLNA